MKKATNIFMLSVISLGDVLHFPDKKTNVSYRIYIMRMLHVSVLMNIRFFGRSRMF